MEWESVFLRVVSRFRPLFCSFPEIMMNHRSVLFLMTLAFFTFLSAVRGGEETKKYISTVLTPDGIRILKIEYPCDKHPTAYVEIKFLTPETTEHPGWTGPLFFAEKWLNAHDVQGKRVKDVMAECYFGDTDDYIARTMRFENPTATMNILGWVGAFGKRDTVVRVKMENPRLRGDETTLVFPNASQTPIGEMPSEKDPFSARAFGFDLVGREFDRPCDIRVWVLRGDDVMIDETLHWEGHVENPYIEEFESVAAEDIRRANRKKDDFFDGDDDDDDFGGDDDDDDDDDSADAEESEEESEEETEDTGEESDASEESDEDFEE